MRKVFKLRCSSLSLIILLMYVFRSIGVEDVNELNIENHLSKDCVSVSNFIKKN